MINIVSKSLISAIGVPIYKWLKYIANGLQKKLHGRDLLLKILSNFSWIFLDKILRLGLSVALAVWVARYLGPAEFGELAYALAFIALFQAVANLGLDGITVRNLSQDDASANDLLGTVFALRLTAGIFCWFSAVLIMAWINGLQDRSVLLTAIIGGSLLFQAADTVDLWFQSQSQSRRTLLAKVSAYIISSVSKVALILNSAPLEAFAATVVVESLITAMGLALGYKRFPCEKRWICTTTIARKLLFESWPFVLGGVSIMIYMRIDQIMIREMLGSHQLGIYAAVLPLASMWQVLPVTLNASLAPFLAKKKAQSEAAYWISLQKIFKAYALLGWIVCVPIIALANFIVTILYGPQYQDGAIVLSIYILTNIFINMGMAQGLWILNERRPLIGLINTLIGAFVCVVGNYLLIPHFGIVGVAMVAVLVQFCSAVLGNLLFSRRIFVMQVSSICWPIFRF